MNTEPNRKSRLSNPQFAFTAFSFAFSSVCAANLHPAVWRLDTSITAGPLASVITFTDLISNQVTTQQFTAAQWNPGHIPDRFDLYVNLTFVGNNYQVRYIDELGYSAGFAGTVTTPLSDLVEVEARIKAAEGADATNSVQTFRSMPDFHHTYGPFGSGNGGENSFTKSLSGNPIEIDANYGTSPLSGTSEFDIIGYMVPEPTTVSLCLLLGAMSLLCRRFRAAAADSGS